MHLARTICPQTQTRLRVYVTPDPPWARDYTRKRFSILFFINIQTTFLILLE